MNHSSISQLHAANVIALQDSYELTSVREFCAWIPDCNRKQLPCLKGRSSLPVVGEMRQVRHVEAGTSGVNCQSDRTAWGGVEDCTSRYAAVNPSFRTQPCIQEEYPGLELSLDSRNPSDSMLNRGRVMSAACCDRLQSPSIRLAATFEHSTAQATDLLGLAVCRVLSPRRLQDPSASRYPAGTFRPQGVPMHVLAVPLAKRSQNKSGAVACPRSGACQTLAWKPFVVMTA